MKYTKNYKFSKCVIASTLLTAGIASVVVPSISNSNATSAIQPASAKIQTGNIIHSTKAQVVNNVSNIVINDVEIGYGIYMAIIQNNGIQEIYVWGNNQFGQLGLGLNDAAVINPTKLDTSVFGQFTSIDINFDDMAGRNSYAIVNTATGQKLYTWGQNTQGQLGLNTVVNERLPKLVNVDDLGNYDSIESVVLSNRLTNDNANMYIVTRKQNKQEIYVAGDNSSGQFGNNSTADSSKFVLIPSASLGNYDSIVKISASQSSVHVVTKRNNNFALYAWGRNNNGQLGLNSASNVLVPTLHTASTIFTSENLANMEIVMSYSSYAWNKATNTLHVWGLNASGQLGLNSTTNVLVPTLLAMSKLGGNNAVIKKVAIGESNSSYAIVDIAGAAAIYVWGNNANNELGLGNTTNQPNPVAFQMSSIGNPANVTKIKQFELPSLFSDLASAASSYAIIEINKIDVLYVWGMNSFGQLANGTNAVVQWPMLVTMPSAGTIRNVKILNGTTYVTLNDDGIIRTYVCGKNTSGELGMGNVFNTNTFVKALPPKQSHFAVFKNAYKLSTTDALSKLKNFDGEIVKSELNKYVDFSSFPDNAKFKIDSYNSDFVNGVLSLTVIPSLIYPPLTMTPINQNIPITFQIAGFKQTRPISTNGVTPLVKKHENVSADQFFSSVIDSNGNAKYTELAKYLDLSSIPTTATIQLQRIPNKDQYQAEFTFFADAVYDDDGQTTRLTEKYSTHINVSLYRFPIELVVFSSVGGTLLLIFLAAAGVVIYLKRKKIRSYRHYI